jgi:hypothetical protein
MTNQFAELAGPASSLIERLSAMTRDTDALSLDEAENRWRLIVAAFDVPESRHLPLPVIESYVLLMTPASYPAVPLSYHDRLNILGRSLLGAVAIKEPAAAGLEIVRGSSYPEYAE